MLDGLYDLQERAQVQARIERPASGNPDDVKPIRGRISKLRIDCSAGYRVYFIKKRQKGKPARFEMEDRLLMTLKYLREYRTYFHVSVSYGISESGAYRTIRSVEEVLVKHRDFALPGRKALL